MSELKLFTDGVETYVARSPEHCLELYKTRNGESRDPDMDPFEEREDNGAFDIDLDGGQGSVLKTHADWIKFNGEGFLCSTEY